MSDPDSRPRSRDSKWSEPPVPREVIGFFGEETGRTLLTRGEPGAGKTLFAVRLLDCLHRESRDVLYASTRVGRATVFEDYFGTEATSLDQSHVADLSPGSDGGPGIDDEIELDRTTLDGFLDWLRSLGDVSNRLAVVFDSWDLIGGTIEAPRVDSIEHRLATFARDQGIDLVFVAEAVQSSNIDYLMDGVVALSAGHDEKGRPERTLRLEKLRGVRIGNRTRPYTLANGVFAVFPSTDVSSYRNVDDDTEWNRISNTKRRFSSGVPALDDLLGGGYRRGSVVHFELSSGLSRDTWSLLVVPLVRNFLGSEQGSLIVPPADTSPGLLRRELDLVLPEGRFDSYCDVVRTTPAVAVPTGERSDREKFDEHTTDDEAGHPTEYETDDRTAAAVGSGGRTPSHGVDYFGRAENIRHRSDGPLLHVIGMETADGLDITLAALADYVAVHNDLAMLVTKPASDQRREIERVADAHLILERRSETLFLRGENPLTPLLGIDIDQSSAIPTLELTEAV